MVHDLHIVVADGLDGKVRALYLGTDTAEANKAYDKAGDNNEAVRVIDFPQATRLRYPAQEAEAARTRATAAETEAQRTLNTKRAAAVDAQAKAKQAAADAEKAAAELQALESPDLDTPKTPESKGKKKNLAEANEGNEV
jgi:ABC-type Na+ efflux pump permease subunit